VYFLLKALNSECAGAFNSLQKLYLPHFYTFVFFFDIYLVKYYYLMNMIYWVRSQLKRSFDRIRNENLKKNALQAIPFWIASVIAGLLAVLYTKLFVAAEDVTSFVFNHHAWMLFILSPFWHGGWCSVIRLMLAGAVYHRLWRLYRYLLQKQIT